MKASVIFLLGAVMLATPSCAASIRNERYGYRFETPKTLHLCPRTSWQYLHDNGILFDPSGNCDSRKPAPGKSMTGEDNEPASEDLKMLHDDWCLRDGKTDRVGPAPALPKLGGKPSVSCQIDHADGSVTVEILTLSKAIFGPRNEDYAYAPRFFYTARLSTTKDRLDRDLAPFRDLVKSVRLFNPPNN